MNSSLDHGEVSLPPGVDSIQYILVGLLDLNPILNYKSK